VAGWPCRLSVAVAIGDHGGTTSALSENSCTEVAASIRPIAIAALMNGTRSGGLVLLDPRRDFLQKEHRIRRWLDPKLYVYLPVIQRYLKEVEFPPVVTALDEAKTAPYRTRNC
jgi:hypothetical protein